MNESSRENRQIDIYACLVKVGVVEFIIIISARAGGG
jgi:hypothetical protein